MSGIIQEPVILFGHGVGEEGDHGFGWNGGVVSRIGVFAGPQRLRAIRLWLTTDVSPVTFGLAQGTYQEFTFAEGERVSSISCWGSTTGIGFTTTHGRTFRHEATSSSAAPFFFDVSSGIWVGVWTRYIPTDGVYAFGVRFLRPIESAQMVDVRYPTLDLQSSAGIRTISVQDFRDENRSYEASKDWTNSGSYTTTTSSSWSVGVGIHVHATVRVSARIPFVASVEGEYGWALDVTNNFETSTEETDTTTWSRSGTIPPRHRLTFQVTTRRGTASLPYEASMQIRIRDGPVFSYPIRGVYDGVAYSRIDITYDMESIDATRTSSDAVAADAAASIVAARDVAGDVTATSTKVVGHKSLPVAADADDTTSCEVKKEHDPNLKLDAGDTTSCEIKKEHDANLKLVA